MWLVIGVAILAISSIVILETGIIIERNGERAEKIGQAKNTPCEQAIGKIRIGCRVQNLSLALLISSGILATLGLLMIAVL